MGPRALVIGLGQPAAGDDAVGIAVVVRLRAQGEMDGVAYETVTDATALVERLQAGVPVIIVDALVGTGRPGEVVVLEAERLAGDVRPLSTHGISVAQAIALARALRPETDSAIVRVVGIVIATAKVGQTALTAPVAAALPAACTKIHELLREVMN